MEKLTKKILTKDEMEKKIKESDEKKDKIIAMIEDYVQSECPSILLIAHNKQGIIMDIPLKGLPNFANEKLLMTELLEAHMARRVSINLERKIRAMIDSSQKSLMAFVVEEFSKKVKKNIEKVGDESRK